MNGFLKNFCLFGWYNPTCIFGPGWRSKSPLLSFPCFAILSFLPSNCNLPKYLFESLRCLLFKWTESSDSSSSAKSSFLFLNGLISCLRLSLISVAFVLSISIVSYWFLVRREKLLRSVLFLVSLGDLLWNDFVFSNFLSNAKILRFRKIFN